MLEYIILFAAGVAAIPLLILGLFIVVSILDYRERSKASYKFSGSVKAGRYATPDLLEYPVKIQKIRKGYRISFLEYDDDLNERVVYSVTLSQVDPPEFD